MRPEEIEARAAEIRLERPKLSKSAGISPRAIRETFAKKRPGVRLATVQALENALLREEHRLLRHLLDLHGVPEGWPAASTGQQRSSPEPAPNSAGSGEAAS